MPADPRLTRAALRATAGLALLALLWGLMLGWLAGGNGASPAALLVVAALSVVGGWRLWRVAREALHAAIAAAGAPGAADVAALEASVAAHEARVRPHPRTPGVVTISEGSGLT